MDLLCKAKIFSELFHLGSYFTSWHSENGMALNFVTYLTPRTTYHLCSKNAWWD